MRAKRLGLEDETLCIDRVRLGALVVIDNGTRGTYSFDAFDSLWD